MYPKFLFFLKAFNIRSCDFKKEHLLMFLMRRMCVLCLESSGLLLLSVGAELSSKRCFCLSDRMFSFCLRDE